MDLPRLARRAVGDAEGIGENHEVAAGQHVLVHGIEKRRGGVLGIMEDHQVVVVRRQRVAGAADLFHIEAFPEFLHIEPRFPALLLHHAHGRAAEDGEVADDPDPGLGGALEPGDEPGDVVFQVGFPGRVEGGNDLLLVGGHGHQAEIEPVPRGDVDGLDAVLPGPVLGFGVGLGVVGLHPDPPVAVVFVFRKKVEHPPGVGLDVDRHVDVVLRVEDLDGHVLFHVRQDLPGPLGEGIKVVFGGVPAQVGLGDDGVDEDQNQQHQGRAARGIKGLAETEPLLFLTHMQASVGWIVVTRPFSGFG